MQIDWYYTEYIQHESSTEHNTPQLGYAIEIFCYKFDRYRIIEWLVRVDSEEAKHQSYHFYTYIRDYIALYRLLEDSFVHPTATWRSPICSLLYLNETRLEK